MRSSSGTPIRSLHRPAQPVRLVPRRTGLTELIVELHRRGVRVLLDYNPWDRGTRRAAGSDDEEVAALVTELRADGVFLDTLKEGDPELVARLQRLDPPPALEGESRLPLARIEDHLLSWAQWFADSEVPGVLRARWYEPRHMLHHTRRWNRDHGAELQSAWVNGTGILIWECVFGSWVGWHARDRATLRAARRVQRLLGDHLVYGEWTPLADAAPEAAAAGVVGSRFDLGGSSLWTLANRGPAYSGAGLAVTGGAADDRWFDLIRGRELQPRRDGASWTVEVNLSAGGIGGMFRVGGDEIPTGLADTLAAAAADPGSSDTTFPQRTNRRVGPAATLVGDPPPDAVRIQPEVRELPYANRQRETGDYGGAPYVEEWKPLPPRLNGICSGTRSVRLTDVAVDDTEVSNAQFAEFVSSAHYQPRSPHRFLAHWLDGAPRPGTEAEPVTYVDLADARAYARWRQARLPTEEEWQVAAGDSAFARRSRRVWNWTESEHTDGRTRFAMVKGGSDFRAEGSNWYVDGGEQPPDYRLKLLLAGGGLARSECIGFRCAVDLAGTDR